nr:AraC family transcriptional regulator [Oceanicoccus sp. KOV_DT_Chl]
MHRQLCWLTQSNLPLKTVTLPYLEPSYRGEYQALYQGAPVEFNADRCSLIFDRKLLERPVKQTPESLADFLRNSLYNVLVNTYSNKSWSRLITDEINKDLNHLPTFIQLASKFKINPKRLRRLLSDEGLTYSELKLQLRRDMAIYHLSRQQTSIEEIAFKTGFSEASAFIRAFKKWTGVTPLTYRKDLS